MPTNPSGLLVGFLVAMILEAAKRHPWIPITQKHENLLRGLLLLACAVAGPAIAYLKGPEELARLDWQAAQVVLNEAFGVLVGAVATYYGALKPQNKEVTP